MPRCRPASSLRKLCKWIVLASATAVTDSGRMEASIEQPRLKDPQPREGPRPLLFVFGDSLSDQGNVYASTNHTEPQPRFYFQGRFTNALCWVDFLDHNVKSKAWEGAQWDIVNYACGGSAACGPANLYVGYPPLASQVSTYIQGQLPPKDQILSSVVEDAGAAGQRVADIIIMEGGNDYIAAIIDAVEGATGKTMEEANQRLKDALRLLPEQVVGCIIENLREILRLTEGGYPRRRGSPIPSHTVRSISIASLPALEDTPFFRKALIGSAEALETLVMAESRHAQLLREGLKDLSALGQQGSPVLSYLDVTSLTRSFFSNAAELGICNVDDTCLDRIEARGDSGSVADMTPCQSDEPLRLNPARGDFQGCCAQPGQCFFYDNVHPSSTIHFHAAKCIQASLENII